MTIDFDSEEQLTASLADAPKSLGKIFQRLVTEPDEGETEKSVAHELRKVQEIDCPSSWKETCQKYPVSGTFVSWEHVYVTCWAKRQKSIFGDENAPWQYSHLVSRSKCNTDLLKERERCCYGTEIQSIKH